MIKQGHTCIQPFAREHFFGWFVSAEHQSGLCGSISEPARPSLAELLMQRPKPDGKGKGP